MLHLDTAPATTACVCLWKGVGLCHVYPRWDEHTEGTMSIFVRRALARLCDVLYGGLSQIAYHVSPNFDLMCIREGRRQAVRRVRHSGTGAKPTKVSFSRGGARRRATSHVHTHTPGNFAGLLRATRSCEGSRTRDPDRPSQCGGQSKSLKTERTEIWHLRGCLAVV